MTTRYDDMNYADSATRNLDEIRNATSRNTELARLLTEAELEAKSNQQAASAEANQKSIKIGSVVSLRGFVKNQSDNKSLHYPAMTVYDIFNVSDDYLGTARCYWFVDGRVESGIFPINILWKR